MEEELSYKINTTVLVATYTQEKQVAERNEGEDRTEGGIGKERGGGNENLAPDC